MQETDGTKRPSALQVLWEWWKRVGKKIGDIQARGLLIFFYFVILGPFAFVVRLATDPLAIKAGSPRGWRPRENEERASMERATNQF